MGDSGSQVIGFGLASLALASSWTAAGATLTSIVLPLLVLAIPILDTTLVTVRRTIERRPVTQGGTDHSSHRLVYYGLSEQQAVAALTLLASLLGATALAYNVLANARVTAIGVLISFVVLVQFASFLGDLQERSRREDPGPSPPLWRAFFSNPRRLVEVLDGLRDHLLLVPGVVPAVRRRRAARTSQRAHLPRHAADPARRPLRPLRRLRDLPADLALRVGARPARDRRRRSRCPCRSRSGSSAQSGPLTDFPLEIFFVDALLCMTLVAASRLALRLLPGSAAVARRPAAARPHRRRRPLGPRARPRAGARRRRRASSASSTTTRRCGGAGSTASPSTAPSTTSTRCSATLQLDEVLVTIPEAASERLELLVAVLHGRGCRLPLRRPRDRAAAVSDPRARRVSSTAEHEPERLSPGAARWLLGVAYLVPRVAVRLAGIAARVAVDLLRRDRVHADLARDRRTPGMPSRLGEPSGFGSLYTYLVAPAWWLDPTRRVGGGEAASARS